MVVSGFGSPESGDLEPLFAELSHVLELQCRHRWEELYPLLEYEGKRDRWTREQFLSEWPGSYASSLINFSPDPDGSTIGEPGSLVILSGCGTYAWYPIRQHQTTMISCVYAAGRWRVESIEPLFECIDCGPATCRP